MGSKGLGITMINMYCDMIDNEFSPIIAMLEARTSGIKPVITRRVKKDFGIYDLLAKKRLPWRKRVQGSVIDRL